MRCLLLQVLLNQLAATTKTKRFVCICTTKPKLLRFKCPNNFGYYMLGDLISEEKGKITSQRVLDVEGGEPKIEMIGVFEYETDESGNTSAKVWEWK
jgi:hypothetical protein